MGRWAIICDCFNEHVMFAAFVLDQYQIMIENHRFTSAEIQTCIQILLMVKIQVVFCIQLNAVWQTGNKKCCPRTIQLKILFIYIMFILLSFFLVGLVCMVGYLITNYSFISDTQNTIYNLTIVAIILLFFH